MVIKATKSVEFEKGLLVEIYEISKDVNLKETLNCLDIMDLLYKTPTPPTP